MCIRDRIRETDLVNRLFSTIVSTEFMDASTKFLASEFEDYKDYVSKYGPIFYMGKYGLTANDKPEHKGFTIIGNYYGHVGILLHRGLIDADLARECFSLTVRSLWKKAEPIIQGLRKELNQPEIGKMFEYLYNEMKKREQKLQHSTT